MNGKLLPMPGDRKVSISKLAMGRARDLATALTALNYVRLVECRTGDNPKADYVIAELEVELPQHPAVDIRKHEVCAIVFPADPTSILDVLALREDFPQVPHLNLRAQEVPRSLCIYEDPFPEFSFKWSPIRFIEDVRGWLARTARNELHQPDQPLEALMEAGTPELVVPNGLLKDVKSGDYLFLNHRGFAKASNCLIIEGRAESASTGAMFAVFLVGTPQTHGLIRKKPADLAELQEFLSAGGIDVVTACQQALRQYIKAGARTGQHTHMTLLVDLPKTRHDGGPVERIDRLAFITHATIDQLSSALGVFEKIDGKVGLLIGTSAKVDAKQLPVVPLRRLETLSPEAAAEFNGTKSVSSAMLFVGLGALGSHIFINLLRAGFGRWTLLDRDIQLPHNAARHALAGSIGQPKSVAMAHMAEEIFPEVRPNHLIGDLLIARDDKELVASAIKDAALIVDCSASVAVGRKLARLDGGGMRVSVFLNPSGTDLVLLGESGDRKIRLDQLEMMYYREVFGNKELASHLVRVGAPVRYANACRDISVILPQDLIALHSGIASHSIKTFFAEHKPQITIWRVDEKRNVRRIDIPVAAPIVREGPDWKILTDEFVIERLLKWRAARLPNETGGILLGSFDMERKIVYVADGLPSPSNSREWPTVYIRGTTGLSNEVKKADRLTQGGLEYVGEWHSHPNGCSAQPSADDLRALNTLSCEMGDDSRPAIMFIVAKTDFKILIGLAT